MSSSSRAPRIPTGAEREAAAAIAKTDFGRLGMLEGSAMTGTTRRMAREVARKRERAIAAEMKRYLRLETEIRVVFVRPRWMPNRLYRRLLRSIVIEERTPTITAG